ncbi:PTS sugar transporter subunit IIA [Streptococcus halotolerans]|uniref:PTS sugar transporter subunit IIA n=1 Tax=Streptococcus halotolerans TaxID=1814128 RepID=UPI00078971E0|nr:PTS sugar transporter subunit IIA [Streptococcus halotolerans]
MRNDDVSIYLGEPLADKQTVLEFLYDHCDIDDYVSQQIFLENLEEREKQGSIEIAEGVILPHFEYKALTRTKIIIIRPLQSIKSWSSNISKVDLVIALLYKTGDSLNEIKLLMQMLANDSFIENLKKKDVEVVSQIIRSKLCK